MPSNPLLDPAFEIPFDRINASHVEPGIDVLIEKAQAHLAAIAHAPRTYEGTLGAMEEATERLEVALTVIGHLEAVATTPQLRETYNRAYPKATAFFSAIPLNEPLYQALVEFSQTAQARSLDPVRARFLKKTLDDFRREGAALSPEDKERLRTIDVALTEKTTRFAQNVLDETSAFEHVIHDEAALAGLPPTARAAARQAAEQKGIEGWRFTLHAPSLTAVMTHLDDRSVRERLWRAYSSRASKGPHDNRGLICEIIALRTQKATLLGFRDFADFVLESRMAKSGRAAAEFLDDLRGHTLPSFAAETQTLQAYRQELEGEDAPVLQPWDVAYYAEKLRESRYDFDDEVLRPYFEVDNVLRGLFGIAERLYGVRIEERNAPVWHEQVRTFAVSDGNQMVASFYVDLYPRDDKRGGAWMNSLSYGPTPDRPHLGLFCANVTEPIGDEPALLTHREVETLFHEFGHLLHHALSEVPIRSLGGTNVAWDFVELPSQIMENFCWERASLDLFARHHKTSEPIPEELFTKMRAARTFRAATAQMRQLGFGTVDLALHRAADDGGGPAFDPSRGPEAMLAFVSDILQAHAPAPYPESYAMICAFTHLFASPVGYAAAYYSYKWAEVLDADAFTRFVEADVLSAEVGQQFRKAILAMGDAEEPAELFRKFMGRDPSLEALLTRSGLAQSAPS